MTAWLSAHSTPSNPPDRAPPEESGAERDGELQAVTVWETDPQGRNYYQSPSWYEYVGTGPGSSFGQDWLAFYHPDDRDFLLREWRKALETEGQHVYDIRVRIRRHDGIYRWFRVRGAPIRDSSGAVTKWIGTCTDIETEQRGTRRNLDQPSAVTSRHYRILVADDNADLALSLRLVLEGMGHQVQVVHDGHSALEVARRMRPDVVFLDIVLPGLNGYEVAQRLRQELGTGFHIVAMSGFGRDREDQRAADAGIDQYLVKPIAPEFIVSLLGGHKQT